MSYEELSKLEARVQALMDLCDLLKLEIEEKKEENERLQEAEFKLKQSKAEEELEVRNRLQKLLEKMDEIDEQN